ncbi:MAG: hypothetical protein KJN63_08690 [Acidimicrobiia bacterium]|nr:hypothetical protein [Acidimicrobiia bacterium]
MSPRVTIAALMIFAVAALAGPILLVVGADEGSAAFGDNETVGVNRLSSATVDIEPGEDIVPITATNLAPGDRVTGSIAVNNIGTLAVRYAIVSDARPDPLSDWLRWEIWLRSDSDQCTQQPAPGELLVDGDLFEPGSSVVLGDVTIGLDAGDRILQPGEGEALCTAVTLSLDAPDEVQARTVRHELVVVAEQHTDDLDGGSS